VSRSAALAIAVPAPRTPARLRTEALPGDRELWDEALVGAGPVATTIEKFLD
jgi:hypothetical protein